VEDHRIHDHDGRVQFWCGQESILRIHGLELRVRRDGEHVILAVNGTERVLDHFDADPYYRAIASFSEDLYQAICLAAGLDPKTGEPQSPDPD
jgi:hypothetical protein